MVMNLPASRRLRFNLCVRKIPWRRKCYPLLYSCLENPMDRGAWRAIVHEVPKDSDITEELNNKNKTLNLGGQRKTFFSPTYPKD